MQMSLTPAVLRTIKSIQRGAVYIPNGGGIVTTTIATVNTAKSVLTFGGSSAPSTQPAAVDGYMTLTNATTITFGRGNGDADCYMPYQVVEYF